MKRRAVQPLYPQPQKRVVTTPEEIEALFRGLRGPRENVAMNLKHITAECFQARHGPHGADARALAKDVRDFRKRLVQDRTDPELTDFFINHAMLIGSAFQKLDASVRFAKPVSAGLKTIEGGAKGARLKRGDHSALIDWARQCMAHGLPLRGLATQAAREGITTLSARQARVVLCAAFPNRSERNGG
jgi:hypothetical protein